jgi:hypothetical protein
MQTEDFLKALKHDKCIEHLRNQCEILHVNQLLTDAKVESLTEVFFGVVANDTSATNPNYPIEAKLLFLSFLEERVCNLLNDPKQHFSENGQKGIIDFLDDLNRSSNELEKEIEQNS